MLWKIAFRQLISNKKRTLLTFLLFTFFVAIFLWMDGIARGMREKSFQNIIQFTTGDFQIRSKNYDENKPLKKGNFILKYKAIEKKLKDNPNIESYTKRIRFIGEIDNGIDNAPVIVWGIDPKNDKNVYNLNDYIVKGALKSGGCLLGEGLYNDLHLKIGDSIYLTTKTMSGYYDSIELIVSGYVNAPDPTVNSSVIYIPIKTAQSFLNIDGITAIVGKVKKFSHLKKDIKQLKKDFPQYNVIPWYILGKDYINFAKADWNSGRIMIYLLVILAFIGILNTMLMSIYEKQKEIGVLKALGFTNREITAIFINEGILLSVFGYLLGAIIGILINWFGAKHGYDMSKFMGSEEGVNFGYSVMGIIKAKWSIEPFIETLVLSVFSAYIGALIPTRHIIKMKPAKILRDLK